jgi:hypothetical protein
MRDRTHHDSDHARGVSKECVALHSIGPLNEGINTGILFISGSAEQAVCISNTDPLL